MLSYFLYGYLFIFVIFTAMVFSNKAAIGQCSWRQKVAILFACLVWPVVVIARIIMGDD